MERELLFREILGENSGRIFRICAHFFRDPGDRDDVYQEILILLWKNLPSFRGASKASTWIYRVAVNACLSYIRKDKRRNELISNGLQPDLQEVNTTDPEEESIVLEDRKIRFFNAFMKGLPGADRMLVSLYLEELTSREIAEITGLSESNVRVKLHRVKERIKTEWEEKEYGTR